MQRGLMIIILTITFHKKHQMEYLSGEHQPIFRAILKIKSYQKNVEVATKIYQEMLLIIILNLHLHLIKEKINTRKRSQIIEIIDLIIEKIGAILLIQTIHQIYEETPKKTMTCKNGMKIRRTSVDTFHKLVCNFYMIKSHL